MKLLKKLTSLFLMLFMISNFSQCRSLQKIEKELPIEIGEVYYQHWIAGVKGGGSGDNLFIPVVSNKNNIILDSVYFKGKQVKLELKNNSMYVGRFASKINRKQDIILSNEPYAEYGNPVPEVPKKIPFDLRESECIVTFQEGNETRYYKISNITKRESEKHPHTPLNRQ